MQQNFIYQLRAYKPLAKIFAIKIFSKPCKTITVLIANSLDNKSTDHKRPQKKKLGEGSKGGDWERSLSRRMLGVYR